MMSSPRSRTVALAVLITCALVAAAQWYIWTPRIDDPAHADAILVLGYSDDRQVVGRELATAGISDNLVVSRAVRVREMQDPVIARDFATGTWFESCDVEYPDYHAYCIVPAPDTTAGEAVAFAELAQQQGWDSVVVATEVSHLGRARGIVERCFPGTVYGVASHRGGPVRALYRGAYEMAAYVKDLLTPSAC